MSARPPAPVIGYSLAQVTPPGRPLSDVQYAAYPAAIAVAGGLPQGIPILAEASLIQQALGLYDGIVFCGGSDLEPRMYGEAPDPGAGVRPMPRLDAMERQLMLGALRAGIPILAICRGMQLLTALLQGSLNQHAGYAHRSSDRAAVVHMVKLDPNSRLFRIIGKPTIGANSVHHQTIKTLGPWLRAVGWAGTTIEAVEVPVRPNVLAVQWHPEELMDNPAHRRILEAHITDALEYRQRRLVRQPNLRIVPVPERGGWHRRMGA